MGGAARHSLLDTFRDQIRYFNAGGYFFKMHCEDYVEWYALVSTGPMRPHHMSIGLVLHLRVVRELNSLSCHAFHSLAWVRLSHSFWRIVHSSLSCYITRRECSNWRCILSYRNKRSIAIRTTRKVSQNSRQ